MIVQGPQTTDERLLLHSLADLREPLLAVLAAVGARRVVEVGVEEAFTTSLLADWAEAVDGGIVCIEPAPSEPLRAVVAASDRIEVVEGLSPEALSEVAPADVYLLDGDHNYHVVSRELESLEMHAPAATLLLHDVGWPCARRDEYYTPELLPREAVHPHSSFLGVVPGVADAVPGGFRSEGAFAVALSEGGPRNGVLTAIEDFLRSRPHLVYAHIPSGFGLGVIFPAKAPYARALAESVAPWDRSPLLERLERNRLALYIRVLALQDELRDVRATADERHLRLVAQYERELGAAHAENVTLRLEHETRRASERACVNDGEPASPADAATSR